MSRKIKTQIGDIFSIPINDEEKRYMQLIAIDLTQLNSDVVRIFEKKYFLEENPNDETIINDKILNYAHCVCDLGLKMNLWIKTGSNSNIGNIGSILFRDTDDYGVGPGEEPIRISNNWFVWHINDETFTKVGKLDEKNRDSYIGIVINPLGIVEIAKGNKYPINYPEFE
ncbi:hypothetical protein RAH57_03800 [Chryseobacterium sp. CKR4-1]|uniref:hypothetical protein n=1 Tax=Chryseobacterium sp. CKR4-1 TaxID=3068896 RepID=UPI0027965459|nr:hypothetical protein [Chryseobacterium sp. CKR4-1]MDQ1803095.1 hypothetical protein [Chryseobacterium sp. CKR4-1]